MPFSEWQPGLRRDRGSGGVREPRLPAAPSRTEPATPQLPKTSWFMPFPSNFFNKVHLETLGKDEFPPGVS